MTRVLAPAMPAVRIRRVDERTLVRPRTEVICGFSWIVFSGASAGRWPG